MTRVEIDTIIERPVGDVFAAIADFERAPRWQSGIKKAQITSTGPLQAGSTYTQWSQFLGREIVFYFQVLRFEPNKLVEFKTTSGTFPVHILRTVAPVPEGTRLTATILGEAAGVFKIAGPLLDRLTQRSIEGDYARLKTLLESQPP